MSEANSGSDVTSMRTTATDCGSHFELNGTKVRASLAALRSLPLQRSSSLSGTAR
jgi:alkylation response protein AidB-like acyl-CoA dehydrogenase